MPTYDWECRECTEVTQVTHSSSKQYDVPPENGCEKCGSKSLDKIIVRPANCKGVILLGETGWHHTDYSKYRSIR